jgi:CRISPR-associated protein Cas6/Cse3/CasE, subtype I-E/ECOLI
MIAGILRLSRADIKALKITDAYSLHRVVYDLFEDVRSEEEKRASKASGILYADKGGDFSHRQILFLANRMPQQPQHGQLGKLIPIPDDFLQHECYRFEVTVNPTKREKASKRLVPIRGREAVAEWFMAKAPDAWGFSVDSSSLQVLTLTVREFDKQGHAVTQGQALLQGVLTVTDRSRFITSFQQGIGRGRAFGCGLLQIVPMVNPFDL